MKTLLLSVHEEQEEIKSPNLGLYRIWNYLNQHGMECDICELGLDDATPFLKRAEAGEYGLIGASSTYMYLEKELASLLPFRRAAERCGAFFCAGGQVPSNFASFWLDIGFDGVIRGYGERPTLFLAQVLGRAGDEGLPDLASVPGLTWRRGAETIENPAEAMTPEIFREYFHTMPLAMGIPDSWLKILDIEDAGAGEESIRYRETHAFRLFTSHKCPNRCGYCSSSKFLENMYGRQCAAFSLKPDEIVDIIRSLYERYGVSFFFINDDEFTSPKAFTREFCMRMIRAKEQGELPEKISLFCQSRVVDFLDLKKRTADVELLSLMKRANLNRITLGVENFSARLLRTEFMHKKFYDDADIMSLLTEAARIGIEMSVNIMIGIPEATPEELEHNFNRLLDVQEMNGMVMMNIYLLPFPGAPIFGNKRYPVATTQRVSAFNGFSYEKQEYFIPLHPDVRNALDHYMNGGMKDADEYFQNKFPEINIHEPRMLNAIKTLVMAKAMNLKNYVGRCEQYIENRAEMLKNHHLY